MMLNQKNTMAKSVGTKKICIDFDEINPRPGGVKLTPVEFFRIFEHFLSKYTLAMNDAYDVTVDYCIEKKFSLTFSSFGSFSWAYYEQIKKDRSRIIKTDQIRNQGNLS